jgi:hypothetical protein
MKTIPVTITLHIPESVDGHLFHGKHSGHLADALLAAFYYNHRAISREEAEAWYTPVDDYESFEDFWNKVGRGSDDDSTAKRFAEGVEGVL